MTVRYLLTAQVICVVLLVAQTVGLMPHEAQSFLYSTSSVCFMALTILMLRDRDARKRKNDELDAQFEAFKHWRSNALDLVTKQQRRAEEIGQQLSKFEDRP